MPALLALDRPHRSGRAGRRRSWRFRWVRCLPVPELTPDKVLRSLQPPASILLGDPIVRLINAPPRMIPLVFVSFDREDLLPPTLLNERLRHRIFPRRFLHLQRFDLPEPEGSSGCLPQTFRWFSFTRCERIAF
uniref:(northern house mosquito) hypothetical protein n=1 Tax=Culex pipiens TaxID=7175 RepID=A0A8D8DK49_CULPI